MNNNIIAPIIIILSKASKNFILPSSLSETHIVGKNSIVVVQEHTTFFKKEFDNKSKFNYMGVAHLIGILKPTQAVYYFYPLVFFLRFQANFSYANN